MQGQHKPRDPQERFWEKVNKTEGCWLWTGCCDKRDGYGIFRVKDGKRRAHIFAYETLVGPIHEGKELDHLCHNPSCVNPAHLEPVTHRVNCQRGIAGSVNRNRQKAKTHCPKGHPYDLFNTIFSKDGRRCCRICGREWYHKKKAKAND